MENNQFIESSEQEVNTDIKYNKSDEDKIVGEVVSCFSNWNTDRQSQLDTIKSVLEMFKVKRNVDKTVQTVDKNGIRSTKTVKDDVASYLKDSTPNRIKNTVVSQMYNSTFKNIRTLFDVELPTDVDNSYANQVLLQKQYILDNIKKANAKGEFRKGIKNWYVKGEMILQINWTQEYETVRRKEGFKLGNILDFQTYKVTQKLKYDGIKIKCIEPEDLVFDTTYDSFDKAPKIVRSYLPLSAIKQNKVYRDYLKKEDYEDIKELLSCRQSSKDLSNIDEDKEFEQAVKDNMAEILTYEGDFTVDGEFYPNMKIVVIARKFVACFRYNPSICSSFLYSQFERDDDTGRGVGLLAHLLANYTAVTDTLQKLHTALGLSVNKCWLAPKGAFDGEMDVVENGVIEYDGSKTEGNKIEPFDTQTGLNICMSYLQYLEGLSESETGRYKYNSGDSPRQERTLGEVKVTVEGQNSLQTTEQDILQDDIVIPMVEKIGQFLANFKEDAEQVKFTNSDGEEDIGTVDDLVRCLDYSYFVQDSSSGASRKLNSIDFLDALMTKVAPYMAHTGQGTIDVKELLNVIGTAYDQTNPEKLIKQAVQPEQAQLNMPEQQIQNMQEAVQPQEAGVDLNAMNQPLPQQ